MSVTVTHIIKCDGLKSLLGKAVHEGELYSPRRNINIHFDDILDYQKVNPEIASLFKKEWREKGYKKYVNDSFLQASYTEKELEQLLHMPVSFKDDNTLIYSLNYVFDDRPLVLISKTYPEKEFEYLEYQEGSLCTHEIVKNATVIQCVED